VLRLSRSVKTSTRWQGENLSKLKPPVDRQVSDLLTEAGGLGSLFLRTDPSPWTGAVLPDGAAVQQALELVRQMDSESLPTFFQSVEELLAQTGLLITLRCLRTHVNLCRLTMRRTSSNQPLDPTARFLAERLTR